MKNFENDAEKPARLKTRASQFTWEKAATAYIEFYKEIILNNQQPTTVN
jgi:glycosyltransferase involved in cell wall biosynthesis